LLSIFKGKEEEEDDEKNKCHIVDSDVPVLLDIFLDATLGFDEGEGRFTVAFRCHLLMVVGRRKKIL